MRRASYIQAFWYLLIVWAFALPTSAWAQGTFDIQGYRQTLEDLRRLYAYQKELLTWCGPTKPVAEVNACVTDSLRRHGLPSTFFQDKERILRAQFDTHSRPSSLIPAPVATEVCKVMGTIASQSAQARDLGTSPSKVLTILHQTPMDSASQRVIDEMVLDVFAKRWWTPVVAQQEVETRCLQSVQDLIK